MDFAGGNNDPFPAAGQFPLEQWFYEMPLCTRTWTTAAVITSILVQCRIISPFNLFYSFRTVFHRAQYWRLLTSFFYFGPLSLDLIFHLFFLQRYARLLEENSGRSPARFSWLLVFAGTCMLCLAPLFSMAFLGTGVSSTLVYIWSRRNPDTLLSFLGILTFRAPFLPWVLMGFTYTVHGQIPKDELAGVVVGHSKLISMSCCDCLHAKWDSLVLFQRHLPTNQRRPSTTRPTWMVGEHVGGTPARREGLGHRRGLPR
jgi:Derlin-2/3